MGLASSLMLCCSCAYSASVLAAPKQGSKEKVTEDDVGKSFLNKTNASNFEINYWFCLDCKLPDQEGRKPKLSLVCLI
jgi:hypothetical protein